MTQKKNHTVDCVPAHVTSREAAEDAIRLSKERGVGWDGVSENGIECGCGDAYDVEDETAEVQTPIVATKRRK
jgi:hypothetical protein